MKWFTQLFKMFRRGLPRLNSREAYALWAKFYPPQAHNPLMVVEQNAMQQLMPDLENKIVLDCACGTGRYGLVALKCGARQVLGLDNNHTMLLEGHLKDVLLVTVQAIPIAAESVDVIICGLALGHVPHLETVLGELSRILRSGGTILVSDFHPFQYLSGARRTFRSAQGKTYQVEHYVHLYSDYHRAGQAAGLQITGVREPCLSEDKPLVLVLRFEKNDT